MNILFSNSTYYYSVVLYDLHCKYSACWVNILLSVVNHITFMVSRIHLLQDKRCSLSVLLCLELLGNSRGKVVQSHKVIPALQLVVGRVIACVLNVFGKRGVGLFFFFAHYWFRHLKSRLLFVGSANSIAFTLFSSIQLYIHELLGFFFDKLYGHLFKCCVVFNVLAMFVPSGFVGILSSRYNLRFII